MSLALLDTQDELAAIEEALRITLAL